MTKLDTRLGYVHCTDNIEIPKFIKEVSFGKVSSCHGSESSFDSGRSTGSNPTSSDSDDGSSKRLSTASSDSMENRLLNNSATSDELYDAVMRKNNENLNIPSGDLDISCDACHKLNENPVKMDDSSETCYLQGKRCQIHSDMMKTTAIVNCTNMGDSVNSGDLHTVYSPKKSPLSHYNKDRKRTPSGGSVIKQIQHAIEKEEEEVKEAFRKCGCPWMEYIVMCTLLFANLLNYMDRYTIAGVLIQVKHYYGISNAEAGLLQTSFIVFYMLFSPIFGYLGDRMNRKWLMACGIGFWSLITLAGSFIPKERFFVFLFMRALVGVGEASYSTIAPTIIADLFVKDKRSKALSFFYFAIPVGSGLGYIVGSNVAKAMGEWQWALRVTPGLGVVCVILILLVVKEPPRGQAEGGTHLHSTSWGTDLKYLLRNKSFMLSTGGFTCVAFVAGALALWAPAYIEYSIMVQGTSHANNLEAQVSLYFGIITCVAGFLGVGIGSEAARRLRKKYPNADPLVCAFGLIMSSPFLFCVISFAKYNTIATWVLIFVGETMLCLNWAIVTDILLYTVIPTRRSTAEAVQILLSHALGDAGSPYLIGLVSDAVFCSDNTAMQNYMSLQYSLYMTCFVAVIGGAFFLATALFVENDRAKADKIIKTAIESASASRETSQTAVDNNSIVIPYDVNNTSTAIAV